MAKLRLFLGVNWAFFRNWFVFYLVHHVCFVGCLVWLTFHVSTATVGFPSPLAFLVSRLTSLLSQHLQPSFLHNVSGMVSNNPICSCTSKSVHIFHHHFLFIHQSFLCCIFDHRKLARYIITSNWQQSILS